MAYTEAQLTELKAITDLDFAKATAFGEKHGHAPRSVVAKAKALGLDYKVKAPGAKSTTKKADVRRKSDVAQSVSDLLDLQLASLASMTLADLTKLEDRAKELVGA
jgi:hypothetical protein